MAVSYGQQYVIQFFISQTDLLAGTSQELIAPDKGVIQSIYTNVQAAVTTGGTIQAVAGTINVAGAVVTVANAATKGTVQSALATVGDASQIVTAGQRIQIKPTGFATAGSVIGHVVVSTSP